MKIAITGGTAGIGNAIGLVYESLGHEVVRLSRQTGHNIRSIPKVAAEIELCDMWVNNAQSGFAQTELLFEVARRWSGTGKTIINISTMMLHDLASFDQAFDEYYVQKATLEQAIRQIKNRHKSINLITVRPGDIATQPNKTVPPSADVNVWAQTLVEILNVAQINNLQIPEISLGPRYDTKRSTD
jgi:NAD(P)-dependent dehydrogenase (short-subunit alcohol dehydrogenase family)